MLFIYLFPHLWLSKISTTGERQTALTASLCKCDHVEPKTPVMDRDEPKGQRGARGVGFVDESERRLTDSESNSCSSRSEKPERTWEI